MKNIKGIAYRTSLLVTLVVILTIASSRTHAQFQPEDAGTCSGVSVTLPFMDVAGSGFFCTIAEAYFSGLTNGTDATHYSPSANVTRDQMSAFVTRTMDQSLKRGSQRAALNQNWTTQTANNLALTTVGSSPQSVQSDGADLWVANVGSTVSRVRASDGKLLDTWTGANNADGVLVAMGKIFVIGNSDPGTLYRIDPTQPGSAGVTIVTINLGINPTGIAYDGQRIWTANNGYATGCFCTGSVSIVTLNPTTVTTVLTGFSQPFGIIYDGANIWVTDQSFNALKKLDSSGNVVMSYPVGSSPQSPAFDGTNIWVPNRDSNTMSVVRATGALSGTVLATLSGNGLSGPTQAAFDGERILVTNQFGASVSLWNASDFTPIGTFPTGANSSPFGACSDGLNFWVTLSSTNKLARF
jgi:hypothetical protein